MPEAPNFPKMEEEVLAYWEKEKIFEKSLEKPAPEGDFVFYEGPPTANGKPGIHHVEARAWKDLFPRYKTMRGYRVPRRAGWDTHGLPVELEVEKQLGIKDKKEIEADIAGFNAACKKSVWKYLDIWIKMTKRMGYWLDLEHPYITYSNEYVESLWGIVKQFHAKGLLEKDYKVVPYCPRCGTPLSSHELAQGYDEAEDPSIYVKFKLRGRDECFLVWTTTPWTLPGNVALAVKEDAEYVVVKTGRDHLILAMDRLSVLTASHEIVRTFKGRELVGLEYEPLFSFVKYEKKAHYVAAADFVSLEDGTGIVHTAVMYGADDFELGAKLDLPKRHVVGTDGKFLLEVKPWAGLFVKDADPKIIADLESRGLLYKQETIKHTYPFCWRCDTPLIYYARDSWFVRMSKLRDKLIKENSTVNWVPEHLREGRFGEWLREVKDWAFSRERYWGTPLPVWMCSKGTTRVVGSFEDFPETGSGNRFYAMRHGESNYNTKEIVSSNLDAPYTLTDDGRAQVAEAIKKLKKEKIDVIVASDFPRTRETAELVGAAIGVPVTFDERIREINIGEWEGMPIKEFKTQFTGPLQRFDVPPPKGETLRDVARRMHDVIYDFDRQHQGKRILIVSHGDPLWILFGVVHGWSPEALVDRIKEIYPTRGSWRALPPLRTLPRDADGLVDPHRPFIDEVTFPCACCGGEMRRVKDVIDVWFDSGAMPFASNASGYPADFIVEAIDQTRGWFYTLLAVAVALGKKAPYKNVISLGHVLDKKGLKMSKSRGNVVDPFPMMEKYGADAVRWYMVTVNQPGDPKLFDEKDLDVIVKKVFLILWNVLSFYKLCPAPVKTNHILDRWLRARLDETVSIATKHLDTYNATDAGRAIAEFVTDLSTWYVRRSRERLKRGEGVETLRLALETVAKLLAPFTPFVAEKLWQELGNGSSVHLSDWPTETKKYDSELLKNMAAVRQIASLAHEMRASAKLPVRQPLSKLVVRGTKLTDELIDVLKDETNIRTVEFAKGDKVSVELDTTITPELKREGIAREIIRTVNDLRKQARVNPAERVMLHYDTKDPDLVDLLSDHVGLIHASLGGRSDILPGKIETPFCTELDLGNRKLWLGLKKL